MVLNKGKFLIIDITKIIMNGDESILQKIKEEEQRERTFNGLTAKEWTMLSKNVWNDVSSTRSRKHIEHGATYPEKLVNRLIKMYTKEKDLVLDPFLGTGTTFEACINTNRNGIGIELNERFFPHIQEIIDSNNSKESIALRAVNDDCRNILDHVPPKSVQLMVTSPPYANFIQKSVMDREKTHKTSLITHENNSTVNPYSEKKEDFGNLDESLI